MMIKEIRNRCILMHLQLKFTSGKDIGPNAGFFISLKVNLLPLRIVPGYLKIDLLNF